MVAERREKTPTGKQKGKKKKAGVRRVGKPVWVGLRCRLRPHLAIFFGWMWARHGGGGSNAKSGIDNSRRSKHGGLDKDQADAGERCSDD